RATLRMEPPDLHVGARGERLTRKRQVLLVERHRDARLEALLDAEIEPARQRTGRGHRHQPQRAQLFGKKARRRLARFHRLVDRALGHARRGDHYCQGGSGEHDRQRELKLRERGFRRHAPPLRGRRHGGRRGGDFRDKTPFERARVEHGVWILYGGGPPSFKSDSRPSLWYAGLLLEHWAQLLLGDVDLDAGALLLQGERDAKVALGPAALHGTRQLIEGELPELHRHADFTRQLERERRILVREPQREVRRIVFSWQEILGQAIEGPFAAARALAQGTEKSER